MFTHNIAEVLSSGKDLLNREVSLHGWVRSFRSKRFVTINDGSCFSNIQAVVDSDIFDEEKILEITVACSIYIKGILKESKGSQQDFEIQVKEFSVLGLANPEEVQYTILQPKKHGLEKLREQAHLRFRTNTFSSIMRIRNSISMGIHNFFQEKGFYWLHTPIITSSDAEGAGETFKVSNLDFSNIPLDDKGKVDYTKDFFGEPANLTVSGQLEGETAAMGLGKVYTFGPTFRAENSNTTRHLAEFWMVEPEMAFYDLDMTMDLAEEFLKYVISYAVKTCPDELDFLNQRYIEEQNKKPKKERSELNLIEKIHNILDNQFIRVSYTEAIEILKDSKPNKKKSFKYPIDNWGVDLQSEHERYLVETHFKKPVILFDYPSDIKAFYMRESKDGKTVSAMDVLFPDIGEIIGGSQREERHDVLEAKMQKLGIDPKELWWYLDIRKYGTVTHSGFGLGLERLILFVTGMSNIRDVIPYPRTPKHLSI